MKSLLIILLLILKSTMSDKKLWTSSKNITRSENWHTVRKNCTGLIFAKSNRAVLYIEQINVERMVLPRSGQVSLSMNAKITFQMDTNDKLNCVTLQAIHPRSWLDFKFWKNIVDPLNIAVPYLERPPSRYDTVLLPEYPNVVFADTTVSKLESHHTLYMSADDDSYDIPHQFPQNCTDKTGCVRAVDKRFHGIICENFIPIEDQEVNCDNPIYPWGFCGLAKCGGLITIGKLKSGFEFQKIKRLVEKLNSFSHASRLPESSGKKVQIFVTEKSYTGASVIESTDLFHTMQSDDSLFVKELMLDVSGPAIHGGLGYLKIGISILFGSLFAAIFMLGLFLYASTWKISPLQYTVRIWGNRAAPYNMHYDKFDERSSILDNQSITGSLWNLNNAFDNTMVEPHSSRKTSCETLGSTKTEDMSYNNTNGEKLQEPEMYMETKVETVEQDVEGILLKQI